MPQSANNLAISVTDSAVHCVQESVEVRAASGQLETTGASLLTLYEYRGLTLIQRNITKWRGNRECSADAKETIFLTLTKYLQCTARTLSVQTPFGNKCK
jgi:hypothetical protein